MRLLAILVLAPLVVTAASPADASRVHYQRRAAPEPDKYTNTPSRAQQQWFRSQFMRMAAFSSFFGAKT